jgi:hypothetical protein
VHFIPPLPQITHSEEQIIQENCIIDKITIPHAKNILVSVTFDGGQNWKYYNEGAWRFATTELEGMTVDTLNNLTAEQLAEVAPYTTVQFRCVLTSKDSQMGKIYYNVVPTTPEATT